jgi:predicted TPR repeat methyltransferase
VKRKKTQLPRWGVPEFTELARSCSERGELSEAASHLQSALALAPDHAGVLTMLGIVFEQSGQYADAIAVLERARDSVPSFAPAHLALGSVYAAVGNDSLAVATMEFAIELDSSTTLAMERLAKHHMLSNRTREAIGLFRRILRRDPSNAHARFFLAGLTGSPDRSGADVAEGETGSRPVTAPPDVIADLFDTYAASFDQHLMNHLRYAVPGLIASAVTELVQPQDGSLRVLDLGCGTGLAGVHLRRFARTLIGVDLSRRMVFRARQRGIYDELHVEDLAATLARERNADLIVAADVFNYVGELDSTFAACAISLRTGGLAIFSIERSLSASVELQRSLRYSHAEPYIRQLAQAHGLRVQRVTLEVLRHENDQPVEGNIYALQRG